MNHLLRTFLILLISSFAFGAKSQPNILLMMVDDLGFADFGCYGSEIETPVIDSLADQGLQFTQFYNTAKCHSSRICLLTGLYTYQAGNQALNRATTIAEVLGNHGYATSMTGKWHLDKEPTYFGFDHYWGHLSGATDCFIGDNTFRLNGKKWNDWDSMSHTTDANVDYAIEFIDEALDKEKPFFHYIAFNAPHYPLQAPKEYIEKYMGRYDAGFDAIRKERFAKQKELGIFPKNMKLPPLPEHIPDWDKLSEKERQLESFRMAIFAAMVDQIDVNIGRLLDYLEKKGELDNTVIMLCSDNGACPFERSANIDIPPWEPESYYLYDASWATVGNTPLRHFKQTQHEGGISSPLIVNWPGKIKKPGRLVRSQGHLIDIMATCIDITGASYPDTPNIERLQGKSLLPIFKGKEREGHEEIYFQFSSCRALRKGDWKAVSFYGHKWELYNIRKDRVEQNNLAEKHPEILKNLVTRWHEMAENVDKAPENARKPVKDTEPKHVQNSWHNPDKLKDWVMPEM
ncbi:MAG: arylsulfatase [Puniceicoccaceae bacterium]